MRSVVSPAASRHSSRSDTELLTITPLAYRADSRGQDRSRRNVPLTEPKQAATARSSRHGGEGSSYPWRIVRVLVKRGLLIADLEHPYLDPVPDSSLDHLQGRFRGLPHRHRPARRAQGPPREKGALYFVYASVFSLTPKF
jgi:hypothetical protein